MSVVGFDIGNENCVIGVAKQRGIDVVLNDESNRETPSVVCFGEKQRFLGSAGAASMMMNPKSTVSQVKRLIGRNFNDPDVQKELKLFPIETSEGPDGGILIHLKYLGQMHTFTPVQILAMLIAHLKELTEKNLEIPISDCVIGIPSYFTDLQRRLYLNAATIAGLKTLRLMHDNTATALSYGIYKTDIPSGNPAYVAFVDIGHCDTQVSIASFEAGQMKILSHAFDRSLGGRDFDEVLFSYFAEKFKEQYSIDVYSNVKACIRLRAACEKLKKVLSANAEAPINIECLMEEKDVKGFIKREEFEKLASGLFDRICIPCNKVLVDSRLNVEQIHSVELVGSGSRIPAIAKLLTSVFRREPSRTVNASECVARGCALQCAMLSPVFRVRDYEVQDSIPFSVGLSLDGSPVCVGSSNVLFPKGLPIPSAKIITVQRSNLFSLEAFYANLNELPPGVTSGIGCFTFGPLQVSTAEKPKVKVKVQLNLHGIVAVESATLIDDGVDDSSNHSSNEEMDIDPVPDGVNGAQDSSKRQSETSQTTVGPMGKQKATKRVEVPVSESVYGGMTKAEILEAFEKELQLTQQDRTMELTKDKKNALESYVYEMRNKLFNTYRSFASDEEREDLSRKLQETEEWLYEEGGDEIEQAYTTRLQDLKKLVDPIENRYKDEEARGQATRELLRSIVDYRMSVDSLPAEDRELIIDECNKAEQWLREKSKQQDTWPKSSDPALWAYNIRSMHENLNLICKQRLASKVSSSPDVKREGNRRDSGDHERK